MQPDIGFQLSVVLNTMQKVVLPAVDDNNKPAQEQLLLAIRTMSAVLERIPGQRRFIRKELRLTLDLIIAAVEILRVNGQLLDDRVTSTIRSAEEVYRDIDADTEQFTAFSSQLASQLTELLALSRGSSSYPQLACLVVSRSESLTQLSRAWCSDNGLEEEFRLDFPGAPS